MMKTRIMMAMLMVCLLASGCVESLYPVYDTKTQVFEKALVGKWVQGKSTWSFAPRDETEYQLTVTDENGRQMPFVARLARVDGLLLLDLYPDDTPGAGAENAAPGTFRDYHHFPVHSFYLVKKLDDVLELGVGNIKEIRAYLKAHPDALAHAVVDDRLLLTAPTPDLQKFVVEHQGLFSGKLELTRS